MQLLWKFRVAEVKVKPIEPIEQVDPILVKLESCRVDLVASRLELRDEALDFIEIRKELTRLVSRHCDEKDSNSRNFVAMLRKDIEMVDSMLSIIFEQGGEINSFLEQ